MRFSSNNTISRSRVAPSFTQCYKSRLFVNLWSWSMSISDCERVELTKWHMTVFLIFYWIWHFLNIVLFCFFTFCVWKLIDVGCIFFLNLKPVFPEIQLHNCVFFSGLMLKIYSNKFLFCGCFQALSHQFVGTCYPFHFKATANLGRDYLRVDA